MQPKDFDTWNGQKKQLHARSTRVYFHEREAWWCSLGVNVGFEEDGTGRNHDRPVVVLKGLSAQTALVVPLTTSPQKHPMRPAVGVVDGKEAHALLSQIRTVDTRRFLRKVGTIDKTLFAQLRKNVREFL